jgi:dTDP-4-amino-4,6-dideoxygalactose transaminase
VAQAGLVPWFVDVDPRTWMLDPQAVRAAMADAPGPVGAVIPVAAFGAMPDLAAWKAFRDETGLPVLVDAAAAFDLACDADLPLVVSLHATKVLGMGEGGYLATRDPVLAAQVRQLTTYGFKGSREACFVATNAKLSEYAAAVGLAALDAWPADRLRFALAAQTLRMALAATPQVGFQPGWGIDWVTSVCVVTVPEGALDAAEQALAAEGIDTRRWWGVGCHRSPAFADCPHADLTATDRLARSTLGLPFAVDLGPDDARRIAQALHRAVSPPTA